MYSVSDAFLRAVRSNTRKYFWTGTIVTKGGMTYEFGAKEIVKGSGYISRQCCGSTEIELGTVYAAEMGITLLSDIDRYTLEDAQVTLVFHLVLADDSVEDVPMGVFEVSEANRLAKCLELKAYDFMLRFDKSFNGFETVGTAYDFIALCCKRCKVEFACIVLRCISDIFRPDSINTETATVTTPRPPVCISNNITACPKPDQ